MDDAKMLAQATACVATCLDVQGTQAQKKKLLETLIAVATTKLQNLDLHQMTQARREYLRATTTDPHLVRLIDTVEVLHRKYERLDYHVQETLALTINGSPTITAFYSGDNEGEGGTIVSFSGIEGDDPVTMWLMLYHLRSCLGLNEAVSLATLSAFLKGMIGRGTMIDDGCVELPDDFDKEVVVVALEEATASRQSGGDARTAALPTAKRNRSKTVEYQCPLRELERLLRVAATMGQGGVPLFKPEDVLSLRLPVTNPRGPFAKAEKLESFPHLLSTPLAAVLMA